MIVAATGGGGGGGGGEEEEGWGRADDEDVFYDAGADQDGLPADSDIDIAPDR